MVFPILLALAAAGIIILVFFPAIILNIALFKILTNPIITMLVIVILALVILKKLGLLNKLKGMVRL